MDVQTFDLERVLIVMQDTKKELQYNKCEGKWYWHSRGDETMYGPFDTAQLAMLDSVIPYFDCEYDEGDGS